MGKKTKDSALLKTRKLLLAKRAEVEASAEPRYVTSCIFQPKRYSKAGEIDIRTAKVPQLVEAYRSLLGFETACTNLGVSVDWFGYTTAEWVGDFRLRIAVINRAETLKFIDDTEAELRRNLTPAELRIVGIDKVMGDIDKILGNTPAATE